LRSSHAAADGRRLLGHGGPVHAGAVAAQASRRGLRLLRRGGTDACGLHQHPRADWRLADAAGRRRVLRGVLARQLRLAVHLLPALRGVALATWRTRRLALRAADVDTLFGRRLLSRSALARGGAWPLGAWAVPGPCGESHRAAARLVAATQQ